MYTVFHIFATAGGLFRKKKKKTPIKQKDIAMNSYLIVNPM